YRGKVPEDFKMISELLEIDINSAFNGINNKPEFLPINKLLDYNTEYYGEPTYIGFLFEKNIPVGYWLIYNGVTKSVLFNSEYQEVIKNYYSQHGISLSTTDMIYKIQTETKIASLPFASFLTK